MKIVNLNITTPVFSGINFISNFVILDNAPSDDENVFD